MSVFFVVHERRFRLCLPLLLPALCLGLALVLSPGVAGGASTPGALTWTGAVGRNWDLGQTPASANWTGLGGRVSTYLNGAKVTFDGTAPAAKRHVQVTAGGVEPAAMNVNFGAYDFTGGTIKVAGAVNVAAEASLGLVVGDAPAMAADTVNFNTTGNLDISGYASDDVFPGSPKTVIGSTNGVLGFDQSPVTVTGQPTVDFLDAEANLSGDGKDVLATISLRWYSIEYSRPAIGDFTIVSGQTFSLGTVLVDNFSSINRGQNQAGVIWNGNTLTKYDGGTLILTADNTYTGLTTVEAGVLQLGNGGAKGSVAGDLLLAAADATVVFDHGAAKTYAGLISGAGALIKRGGGVLTLDGDNTYTGGTAINSGTLALGPAGSLASGGLSLSGGGTFDYAATSASPAVLKNLIVSGQDGVIKAGANAADFTNGSLAFLVPSTAVSGSPLLTVTGGGAADITGASVSLDYQTVRPSIRAGQSLTLLAATSLSGNQTGLTVQTASGDVYILKVDNNRLLAVLRSISPTSPVYERLKAYAEGRVASLAFVNQGADLILNQGMGSALMSTRGPGFQFGSFAAGSGGWSRYNTGSHVDVSGASMLAGLAVGNDAGPGRITVGAFFEGGWGNYNSYNSFSNYSSAKGDGDTDYYGGGILGRYDLTSGALSGLYFDASARMGRASADFGSSDITYNGSKADFDTAAMYWGAHAGLGYQWSFTEKAMLDMSGKFIWTRQDGDKVNVHGDKVRFKDADSLRTRLGGRFNYAVCGYATPYIGAYWEHEFDGKQRSSVNGVGIGSPDLKGDTGVGELGLTIKPVKDSGFSMDLGVQGYTGVREGVTGSLQLKFEF